MVAKPEVCSSNMEAEMPCFANHMAGPAGLLPAQELRTKVSALSTHTSI